MKKITKIAFQGDVCLRRVEAVPEGYTRRERKGPIIVAHSETGHHHTIDDSGVVLYEGSDPLRCYLLLESVDHCDVVHRRAFDTHETIRLGGGAGAVYEAIRQREYQPDGWRRAAD